MLESQKKKGVKGHNWAINRGSSQKISKWDLL